MIQEKGRETAKGEKSCGCITNRRILLANPPKARINAFGRIKIVLSWPVLQLVLNSPTVSGRYWNSPGSDGGSDQCRSYLCLAGRRASCCHANITLCSTCGMKNQFANSIRPFLIHPQLPTPFAVFAPFFCIKTHPVIKIPYLAPSHEF